jgi:hypothetical protein
VAAAAEMLKHQGHATIARSPRRCDIKWTAGRAVIGYEITQASNDEYA